MNLNIRSLIDSVILAVIIFMMRQDIVLALVIAVVNYVLRMINF
jgi:hypothetical protein